MAELEDKLNALLSDPDSMAQVMQMAQQLSAAMGSPQEGSPAPPLTEPDGAEARLLQRLLPLVQEYSRGDSRTMQLLMALRPFLRPEKQEKVEQAARLSHAIHVGKRLLLEREDGHV